MSAKTPLFLVKKPASSSYFFRAVIPLDLRESVGTREFLLSLQTGLLAEAKKLALRLYGRLEELLAEIRKGMSLRVDDLKTALVAYKIRLLKEPKTGENAVSPKTRQEVKELVDGAGIDVDCDSLAFTYLCQALQALQQDKKPAAKLLGKMLSGTKESKDAPKSQSSVTVEAPETSFEIKAPKPANASSKLKPTPPKTSVVIEQFLEEMERGGTWNPKTAAEYKAKLGLFLRIVGDLPITEHSFQTARDYKQTMLKLPANLNKDPRYRTKNLAQILKSSPRPMSAITVNNHLMVIASFFEWARKNGLVAENWASGLKIKIKKRAQDQRQVFSQAEIQALVHHLPQDPERPYRSWIPLIGLYSGMRLNEIAQLHLDDLKQEEGLWVFDINGLGKNKKIKTLHSERQVPIHNKLIELGLLEFADALKRAGFTRLFPELKAGRDGYGKNASRWFNEILLPQLGIKEPGKCFHSFRHTVADHLKQKGVAKSYISELLGHCEAGETFGRYSKRYHLETLQREAVERLEFSL